jgi:hypothetical protein
MQVGVLSLWAKKLELLESGDGTGFAGVRG